MRFKRALTEKQMKFLLKNTHLSNKELAEKMQTTAQIVASYKSKARKSGVDIPYQKKKGITIQEDVQRIVRELSVEDLERVAESLEQTKHKTPLE